MNEFENRFKNFCSSLDKKEISSQKEVINIEKNIKIEKDIPKEEVIEPKETYGIWKLSLPHKLVQKIGWNFPTREEAFSFVLDHTKSHSKICKESDDRVMYYYDVFPESIGPKNMYENSSIFTTVGNDRQKIYERWKEEINEADSRDDQWMD